MSKRTSIVEALTTKLKSINGTGIYNTNIFNNAYPILKFWDEVSDFPCVYVTPGPEQREYFPGNFTWAFLNISIKLYAKGENAQAQMEDLLEDVERCINLNRELEYDSVNKYSTTEILVNSVMTDEGLLAPYAVGEISAQVRYQLMQ